MPGLVFRWVETLPHLSKSAIDHRLLLRHLPDLTEQAMNAWIVSPKGDGTKPSNNYVRQRVHTLKSFIEWLIDR